MRTSRFSRRNWMAIAAGLPAAAAGQAPVANDGFVDILRPPDLLSVFLENESMPLTRNAQRWTGKGIAVHTEVSGSTLPVRIEAPDAPLLRLHLRWKANVPERWRILNDQWERSYGDLEWRGMVGERVLPWYFLAFEGQATHGYGVATGGSSFTFWQVDPVGISLWIDVRNGGGPVRLGQRTLEAASVRVQRGRPGETAFASAGRFCRALCGQPRLTRTPVYGGNNWYYAYGQNCSAGDILRDSSLMAELAPAGTNRPFMVIDDGWSVTNTAGPWERGNSRFPDMPGLAGAVKKQEVRPGIWLRPLFTTAAVPQSAQLRRGSAAANAILDPSIPDMLEIVRQDIRRMVSWGFDLVKHDYTSFDLMGRWGSRWARTSQTPAGISRTGAGPLPRSYWRCIVRSGRPPAIHWFWAATPLATWPRDYSSCSEPATIPAAAISIERAAWVSILWRSAGRSTGPFSIWMPIAHRSLPRCPGT